MIFLILGALLVSTGVGGALGFLVYASMKPCEEQVWKEAVRRAAFVTGAGFLLITVGAVCLFLS